MDSRVASAQCAVASAARYPNFVLYQTLGFVGGLHAVSPVDPAYFRGFNGPGPPVSFIGCSDKLRRRKGRLQTSWDDDDRLGSPQRASPSSKKPRRSLSLTSSLGNDIKHGEISCATHEIQSCQEPGTATQRYGSLFLSYLESPPLWSCVLATPFLRDETSAAPSKSLRAV